MENNNKIKCPFCGYEVDTDSVFCPICGHSLPTPASEETPDAFTTQTVTESEIPQSQPKADDDSLQTIKDMPRKHIPEYKPSYTQSTFKMPDNPDINERVKNVVNDDDNNKRVWLIVGIVAVAAICLCACCAIGAFVLMNS